MISELYPLLRPLLRLVDPESAHAVAIKALSLMPIQAKVADPASLATTVLDLKFSNPVGLAPGFDKQCLVPDQLLGLGFGFVECGGVVPRPQQGNPRPRLFRLEEDQAIINRFGLNSDGLNAIEARLAQRAGRGGIVGVNIGPNRDTTDRAADYVTCIKALNGLASFLTLNVSSPNTPGLRDLEQEVALDALLARSLEARDEAALRSGHRTPILLKISPDISLHSLDGIAAIALMRGIDGMVISNTTIARPETLRASRLSGESGGLSGKPLFQRSTSLLAQAFLRLDKRMPLIGVGGIDSGAAAWAKIRAGASLIQLYSALVFKGPGLVLEIKETLSRELENAGLSKIDEAVGRDAISFAAPGEL